MLCSRHQYQLDDHHYNMIGSCGTQQWPMSCVHPPECNGSHDHCVYYTEQLTDGFLGVVMLRRKSAILFGSTAANGEVSGASTTVDRTGTNTSHKHSLLHLKRVYIRITVLYSFAYLSPYLSIKPNTGKNVPKRFLNMELSSITGLNHNNSNLASIL